MERFNYDCAFDFAEDLCSIIDDGIDFTVVATTDTIECLFKDMLSLENFNIMSIEFSKSCKEHVLEVDTNMNIYIYSYELGTRICDDVVYIESDCNSKIIKYCDCEEMFEFGFGEDEEECDGDCENCPFNDDDDYHTELSRNENGEIVGFTRSKSYGNSYYSESFYSLNPELVFDQLNKYNF